MKITIEAYGHKTEVDIGHPYGTQSGASDYLDSSFRNHMVDIIKATFDKFIELITKSMSVPDPNILKKDKVDPAIHSDKEKPYKDCGHINCRRINNGLDCERCIDGDLFQPNTNPDTTKPAGEGEVF